MSLSCAVIRALPVTPLVAVWLLTRHPLVERVTLGACRAVFP